MLALSFFLTIHGWTYPAYVKSSWAFRLLIRARSFLIVLCSVMFIALFVVKEPWKILLNTCNQHLFSWSKVPTQSFSLPAIARFSRPFPSKKGFFPLSWPGKQSKDHGRWRGDPLRNNLLSPPNLLNPWRGIFEIEPMTISVKLSYFKKQRSGQLRPILLPLFSSTFHESDKLYDREKKCERRQRRRRSKLGGLEAFSPRKFSIEGLGNAISHVFC